MGKAFTVLALSFISVSLYASSFTLFGETSKDGYKYAEVGVNFDLSEDSKLKIRAGGAQDTGIPTSGNLNVHYGVRSSDFLKLGFGGRYIRDASSFSPGIGGNADFTFTISEWWKGHKFTDLVLKAEYTSFATPLQNQRMGQIGGGVELVQEISSWLIVGGSVKKFNYSLNTTGGSTSVSKRVISTKLGGMDGYPEVEGTIFFDFAFGEKWTLGLSYTKTTYQELVDDAKNSAANIGYQISKAVGLGLSFVNFQEAESSNLVGVEFSYSW